MLHHELLLPLQSFDNISMGAYGETYVATARESLDAPYVALQYSRSFLPVSRLESLHSLQLPDCMLCLTASASLRCWHPQALSMRRSPLLVASDSKCYAVRGHGRNAAALCVQQPAGTLSPTSAGLLAASSRATRTEHA